MYFSIYVSTGFEDRVINELKKRIANSSFSNSVILHNIKENVIRNGRKITKNLFGGYIIIELKNNKSFQMPPALYHILKKPQKVLKVITTAMTNKDYENVKDILENTEIVVDETSDVILEEIRKNEKMKRKILRNFKTQSKKNKKIIRRKVKEIKDTIKLYNNKLKTKVRIEKKLQNFCYQYGKSILYIFPKYIIKKANIKIDRYDSFIILSKIAKELEKEKIDNRRCES